jgi:cation diffusion facilitator CzcD-associated flavoprotein CzcO
VVVIGSGATAVTLIPALARSAEHVTMLQRSPSYITTLPSKDPIAGLLRRLLPSRRSGAAIRWFKAVTTQGMYALSRRRPKLVKWLLRKAVQLQLPRGYDVDTHFAPRYDPWDQRLCVVPNGDLFKTIKAGAASVVTDQIETFTEGGLRLVSGDELDADIVITATGLELLFIGGIDVSVDGAPVDLPSKLTYKGMMLEGVPNFALAVGYTNASWTLKCDLTCDYVCRLLNHLHDTGLRQCTPVNRDASVTAEPLLGLTSGYIQRAVDRFPKQGSKFPWQVHQSYLRDHRALKRSGIEDEAMVFSNPTADAEDAAGPTGEPAAHAALLTGTR